MQYSAGAGVVGDSIFILVLVAVLVCTEPPAVVLLLLPGLMLLAQCRSGQSLEFFEGRSASAF